MKPDDRKDDEFVRNFIGGQIFNYFLDITYNWDGPIDFNEKP